MAQLGNVGSPIIEAYLHGLSAYSRRKEHADELTFRREQEKEKERQFNETEKRLQKQFDINTAAEKALHDLQIAHTRQQMLTSAAQTGLPIPGSAETLSNATSPEEDLSSLNNATYNSPEMRGILRPGAKGPAVMRNLTLGDQTFQIPDVTTYAQQQAGRQSILSQPEIDKAISIASGVAKARLPGQIQLQNLKNTAAQEELTTKEEGANKRNAATNAARITAAGISRSKNDPYDKPLTDAELMRYPTLKKGATLRDAVGLTPIAPPTAGQKTKIAALESLYSQLDRLEKAGQMSNWSEHSPLIGGMRGTARNITGTGTEAGRQYRNLLGEFTSEKLKENYGTRLTQTELGYAKNYIPGLSEDAKTAIGKIKTAKQSLRDQIDALKGSSFSNGANFSQTATGPNGHKIGSNDGQTWFDLQTGQQVQ